MTKRKKLIVFILMIFGSGCSACIAQAYCTGVSVSSGPTASGDCSSMGMTASLTVTYSDSSTKPFGPFTLTAVEGVCSATYQGCTVSTYLQKQILPVFVLNSPTVSSGVITVTWTSTNPSVTAQGQQCLCTDSNPQGFVLPLNVNDSPPPIVNTATYNCP